MDSVLIKERRHDFAGTRGRDRALVATGNELCVLRRGQQCWRCDARSVARITRSTIHGSLYASKGETLDICVAHRREATFLASQRDANCQRSPGATDIRGNFHRAAIRAPSRSRHCTTAINTNVAKKFLATQLSRIKRLDQIGTMVAEVSSYQRGSPQRHRRVSKERSLLP